MRKCVYLLLLTLLLVAPGVFAAPDGKALYDRLCSSCHQALGKGGIGLPLSTIKLQHVSDDYLFNTIRLGRPGRIMPAYQSLSDAQVNALVSHMRSWSDQPAPQFSDERISGDLANGQKLYDKHCTKCHGNDGAGEGEGTGVTKSRKRRFLVMPAAINNPAYHASVTDAEIREIIVADREDSKMPSMQGKLTDQEINDVVVYVRSLKQAERSFAEVLEEPQTLSRVIESPNDFETTIEAARQALTGSNFRLFPERFLEQGLIDEFTHNTRQVTLRFCNFKALYRMLKIEPRLGVILPCRLTILEREDGQVLLVAPNIKLMASWFNNDELFDIASQMENNLQGVIDEATF